MTEEHEITQTRTVKQTVKKRDHLALLWRVIERDYVENGTTIAELSEKFQRSRAQIHKRARDGEWKKKRAEFRKPKPDKTALSANARIERFWDWASSATEALTVRFMKQLEEEREGLAKSRLDPTRFVDTFETIGERANVLSGLVALGKSTLGAKGEPEPDEIDYVVEVSEQRTFYRRVEDGDPDDLKPDDIIIDVTPETEKKLKELGVMFDAKPNGGVLDDEQEWIEDDEDDDDFDDDDDDE